MDIREHFQVGDVVEVVRAASAHFGLRGRVTAIDNIGAHVEGAGGYPFSQASSLKLIERDGKPAGDWLQYREPDRGKWCTNIGPVPHGMTLGNCICTRTKGHPEQCMSVDATGELNGRWWGCNPEPKAPETIPSPPPAAKPPTSSPSPDRLSQLESELSAKRAEALRIERALNVQLNELDMVRAELTREKTARIKAEDKVKELTREIARMKKGGW